MNAGEREPALVHGRPEHHAREGQDRGFGLERPPDVPLLVKLTQPAVDPYGMGRAPADAVRDLAHDLPVGGLACLTCDPFDSARDDDPVSCNNGATGRWRIGATAADRGSDGLPICEFASQRASLATGIFIVPCQRLSRHLLS